jgi:hypothetical protein
MNLMFMFLLRTIEGGEVHCNPSSGIFGIVLLIVIILFFTILLSIWRSIYDK